MALGLAEGIKAGWGMMSDVYDSRDRQARLDKEDQWRREQAEKQDEWRIEERDYRRGRDAKADQDRENEKAYRGGRDALADYYREEQRKYRERRDKESDDWRKGQADYQRGRDEKTDRRLDDAADRQKDAADHAEAERKRIARERTAAEEWTAIANYYAKGDFDRAMSIVRDSEVLTDDKTLLGIHNALQKDDGQLEAFRSDVQKWAETDGEHELSAGAKAAIQSALIIGNPRYNISNEAYVEGTERFRPGTKITEKDFPAAPAGARGGTIVGVTIHDLEHQDTVDEAGNPVEGVAVRLDVRYRLPNGREVSYYPMMTEGRDPKSDVVVIDIGDGIQAMAGVYGFRNWIQQDAGFVGALEQELLKRPEIKAKSDRIYKRMDDRFKSVEGSTEMGDAYPDVASLMTPYQRSLSRGQISDAQQISMMTDLANQIAIYGEPLDHQISVRQEQFKQTESTLMDLELPVGGTPTQSDIMQSVTRGIATRDPYSPGSSPVLPDSASKKVRLKDILAEGQSLPAHAIGNLNAMSAGDKATPAETREMIEYLRRDFSNRLKPIYLKD